MATATGDLGHHYTHGYIYKMITESSVNSKDMKEISDIFPDTFLTDNIKQYLGQKILSHIHKKFLIIVESVAHVYLCSWKCYFQICEWKNSVNNLVVNYVNTAAASIFYIMCPFPQKSISIYQTYAHMMTVDQLNDWRPFSIKCLCHINKQ